MKSIGHSFLLSLIVLSVFGQTSALKRMDRKLAKQYAKIITFRQRGNSDAVVVVAERNFAKALTSYISQNPSSFTYSFPHLLATRDIMIATSPDSLFRIYSWDKYSGGSMRFTGLLYQYKTKDKVHVALAYELHRLRKDPGLLFDKIDTLNTENGRYYLAFGDGAYSNLIGGRHLKFFRIKINQLVDTVALLQSRSGEWINEIRYNYNLGLNYPSDTLPNALLFNNKQNTLNFPIVDPMKDSVTSRSEIYQFNGSYFEYKTTQKYSQDFFKIRENIGESKKSRD